MVRIPYSHLHSRMGLTLPQAADQMSQQMQQMNPGSTANMFAPGQDPNKMYLAEAENLEVAAGQHEYVLEGIEDRMLALL